MKISRMWEMEKVTQINKIIDMIYRVVLRNVLYGSIGLRVLAAVEALIVVRHIAFKLNLEHITVSSHLEPVDSSPNSTPNLSRYYPFPYTPSDSTTTGTAPASTLVNVTFSLENRFKWPLFDSAGTSCLACNRILLTLSTSVLKVIETVPFVVQDFSVSSLASYGKSTCRKRS